MAKPLTQKQLKAELKKAQERLEKQKTQLASLEQNYAALTDKPSPAIASQPNRIVYGDDYLDATPSTASRPAFTPTTTSVSNDPSLIRDTKTGLSPVQAEARKDLESISGPDVKLVKPTGSAGQLIPKPAVTEDDKFIYDYVWVGGTTGSNIGSWKQTKRAKPFVPGFGGGSVFETPKGVFGSVEGTSTARALGRDQFKNSLALFFGAAEAAKPWVDALYDVVSKFYRTGSDVNESFNLALQDARNNPALKPFTDRFKGIYALQDLKLTGKPVLVPTIAEYVVSQAKMADVLTQANLGDIATDEFTTELISKGNSVTTIAEKIAKVYQRIDMAPKAIKDTFSRFLPTVDRTKLARTLLLGEKGVNELVDELETFEVLASAEQQGVGAINRIGGLDLGRAQEYARSGQTYASLTPQFSKIARALPTTTKLSEISKVEDIGQVGLEKALISQSAKELEQLELLGEQEIARLSAKAGRAELGLASQRRANRAF